MTQDIDSLRKWLELGYFASAPLLAVLAAWGLRQITVTKNNARTSAKRESYRLAAEQCHRFNEAIIPKMNHYDDVSKKIKWDLIDKADVQILDNGFKVKASVGKLDDALDPRILAALEVLNSLESFAIFFTTGLADEQLAFSSVARTYCLQVKEMLPLVATLSEGTGEYRHLLRLFFLWNGRLNKSKLLLDKQRIEKRIKEIGGRTVTPLGLED